MQRREFLGTLGSAAVSAQTQPARPNVIIFLTDDLAHADLGFTGADYIKTPNIDALAASGM
jgi:arylsulfatase